MLKFSLLYLHSRASAMDHGRPSRPSPEKCVFCLGSHTAGVGVRWTHCEKVSWPLQGPALPSRDECLERAAQPSGLGFRADPSQASLPPPGACLPVSHSRPRGGGCMLKAVTGPFPPARGEQGHQAVLSACSTPGEGQGTHVRPETFLCGFAATGRVSAQGRGSAGAGLGGSGGLATAALPLPPDTHTPHHHRHQDA